MLSDFEEPSSKTNVPTKVPVGKSVFPLIGTRTFLVLSSENTMVSRQKELLKRKADFQSSYFVLTASRALKNPPPKAELIPMLANRAAGIMMFCFS